MRIRIIWLVLLAILATSQADRTLAQEVSTLDRFQLFNECRPMRLLVGELSPDAAKIGLPEASIKVALESRLRSARLYDSDTAPHLFILATVFDEGAFSVGLQYRKVLRDLASDETVLATSWSRDAVGRGDAAFVLSGISQQMDQFLVEYLRVNESACK